jgi:hypothetical protein
VGAVPQARRRAAAAAAVGLLAVAGAVGVRQAYVEWPSRRATFDSFRGEDTLIGAAAARWDRYGAVSVNPGLGRSDTTIGTVRRYGLWPDAGEAGRPSASGRSFRIVRSAPAPCERQGDQPPGGPGRVVERIRDAFGREWAVVLGWRAGAR